jgi:hypothetical protein
MFSDRSWLRLFNTDDTRATRHGILSFDNPAAIVTKYTSINFILLLFQLYLIFVSIYILNGLRLTQFDHNQGLNVLRIIIIVRLNIIN